MGCLGGARKSIEHAKTWAEVNEFCKEGDQVKKQHETVITDKETAKVELNPTEKQHKEFYQDWNDWDPELVKGKAFSPEVCKKVDDYYALLYSEMGDKERKELQKTYIDLTQLIEKLPNEQQQVVVAAQ